MTAGLGLVFHRGGHNAKNQFLNDTHMLTHAHLLSEFIMLVGHVTFWFKVKIIRSASMKSLRYFMMCFIRFWKQIIRVMQYSASKLTFYLSYIFRLSFKLTCELCSQTNPSMRFPLKELAWNLLLSIYGGSTVSSFPSMSTLQPFPSVMLSCQHLF